jgi:AcrR family transcriptional regulator
VSAPTTRAAKRAATARKIIKAAQHEFGEHGLEGTTVRAIAKRARVDPSLVVQHYGSKAELFAIATLLPADAPDAEVAAHLFDVLKLRMGALAPETRALTRSMLTAPAATAEMKAFLDERVANLAQATGGPDAELRAALTVSSILGLTVARHFLKLDALTDVSDGRLTDVARSWLTAASHAQKAAPPADGPG